MPATQQSAARWLLELCQLPICYCCVQACKLPYMKGRQEQLQRLAEDKALRDGLASFPFSPAAEEAVPEDQRPGALEPAQENLPIAAALREDHLAQPGC